MNPLGHCCAIVVAAGNSSRMQSETSKIWLPLLGVPAIVRTLFAFEQTPGIDSIVVVCREQDKEAVWNVKKEYYLSKIIQVVCGAETRQESVAAGVRAAPEEAQYFAIHDGARPLIEPKLISRVLEDARIHGASALAVPVQDTIKRVDENGFVTETPVRDGLWAVQTPQVFQRTLYLTALQAATQAYTDDCQLIEYAGGKVHLCESSPENRKLTTPADLVYAEAVLKSRREKSNENRSRI